MDGWVGEGVGVDGSGAYSLMGVNARDEEERRELNEG